MPSQLQTKGPKTEDIEVEESQKPSDLILGIWFDQQKMLAKQQSR
jgi:hypothetical protein